MRELNEETEMPLKKPAKRSWKRARNLNQPNLWPNLVVPARISSKSTTLTPI